MSFMTKKEGKERKRQKNQVDKYDPVKQLLYIDSLIFNNSYKNIKNKYIYKCIVLI